MNWPSFFAGVASTYGLSILVVWWFVRRTR